MFEQRWCDRNVGLLVLLDRLASLHDAPTVVTSTFDSVNDLAHFPPDIGRQQVTGLRIEGNFPRIPKPIGPDLASNIVLTYKRIVRRNPIRLLVGRVIHVDAQNRSAQIASTLPRAVTVGRVRRLAVAH